MESFALKVREFAAEAIAWLTPHFRQLLRFCALPYCYFFLVNWKECTASRVKVAFDLLYIFFVLRSFPDNYSMCRLYEKDRREWSYYYGSGYNPFQKGKLVREVQPLEYRVVFEDKEVCQSACEGLGITVPRCLGTLDPRRGLGSQLKAMTVGMGAGRWIAKPVRGAAGAGIFLVTKSDNVITLVSGDRSSKPDELVLQGRAIVQEMVVQHPDLARIHPSSLNSMRFLTFLTRDDRVLVLAALIRFGVGQAFIDNWSAGGIAVGIDYRNGRLYQYGYDKRGRRYAAHPDSGAVFADLEVPCWNDVVAFATETQRRFAYYRLLGLDIAVAEHGPVLIEINAIPDLAGAEQNSGPFLRRREIWEEFKRDGLLISRAQAKLFTGK